MMDKSWAHRENVQSLRHEACSTDRTNSVNKITQSSDSLNELCTRGGRWQHWEHFHLWTLQDRVRGMLERREMVKSGLLAKR
jgi:hypothetical protein